MVKVRELLCPVVATLLCVFAAILLIATLAGVGNAPAGVGSVVEPPVSPPPAGTASVWPVSEWSSVRLPTWFLPLNYSLLITAATDPSDPGLMSEYFEVKETIWLDQSPGERKTTVVFHAGPNLAVSNVRLQGSLPDATYYNQTDELFFAKFPAQAFSVEGPLKLELDVRAKLEDNMVGFYRSRFVENGKELFMASTDFEPTGARRAFACFDEPAMKSVFQISIVHPRDFVALSNMFSTSQVPAGVAQTLTSYAPTVKMSTYLLAWAIAPRFKSVTSVARLGTRNVSVSVWARESALDHADYAADVGARVVEFYSEWFDIDFPLPKIDMIAIPNYPNGAMENWGLITYRETALLYRNTTSSRSQQQRVATVVAHELAHQWFGNLVTMRWWQDLWLNEGFASFFEYVGVNAVHPEWEMLDQFSVSDREQALDLDAMESSHPILQPVNRPEEIGQLFDAISYQKGASVLSMLNFFVTQQGVCNPQLASGDPFQAGLRAYLQKFKYGNAETHDLWQAIEDKCGFKIVEMMTTWTSQKGFPLVNVSSSGSQLSATQTPFYALASKTSSSALWKVPFLVSENGGAPKFSQFDTRSIPLTATPPFVVNPGASGFYRVNYPSATVDSLLLSTLARKDRASLISDLFALAEIPGAEKTPDLVLKSFDGWLRAQRDFVVWTPVLDGLTNYLTRLEATPLFSDLQQFVLNLIRPTLSDVSNDDGHLAILLRARMVNLAVWLNDQSTVTDLDSQFVAMNNLGKYVIPDDRYAVYRAGIQRGGVEAWESVFARYRAATSPSELNRCLSALCRTPEHSLLRKLLDMTLDPTIVKPQDRLSVLSRVSANIHGRSLAWSWFRQNYDELVKTFAGGNAYLTGRLVLAVAGRFSTRAERVDVKTFFDARPLAAGSRGIEQTLERIDSNIAWIEEHQDRLGKYLASRPFS